MINTRRLDTVSQSTSVELGRQVSKTQIAPSMFCQNDRFFSLLGLAEGLLCSIEKTTNLFTGGRTGLQIADRQEDQEGYEDPHPGAKSELH